MDELTRQRDSITTHLNQLRQLIGGMQPPIGGAEEALAAPAGKAAIAAAESPKPAPAAAGAKGKAAPAADKDSDEDWWQE